MQKNQNKVIYYDPASFSNLPSLINEMIDRSNSIFCFAVIGQNVSDDAFKAYSEFMKKFEIGFAFYPYSEVIESSSNVFGRRNPLIEIEMINGEKLHVARQINFGAMFFDPEMFSGMKLDTKYKFAFMDKFVDDIASIGAIPTNGMFLDIYESWKLFSKYRRGGIQCDSKKYSEEISDMKLTLDNTTSKIVKHINHIQEKLGLKKDI